MLNPHPEATPTERGILQTPYVGQSLYEGWLILPCAGWTDKIEDEEKTLFHNIPKGHFTHNHTWWPIVFGQTCMNWVCY